MALTAEMIRKLGPELTEFLARKASEAMDEPEASEAPETLGMEAAPGEGGESPEGMGVVIAMKPKGVGGKVPGCPDCEDGTQHEHVGK